MKLTALQKKLWKEAEQIAELAMLNFWNIESVEPAWRTVGLRIAISRMVVAEVITRYTLLDEVLTDYLCRYYFKKPGNPRYVFWKRKKFRLFVHFMLDEMYLLKKMQMAHAIRPIPKDVRLTIERVNAIRNALAHSFFPENRKEYMKVGKIIYKGNDIRSVAGLTAFKDDCHEAHTLLRKRVNSQWKP